jgi:hypothetical protein
MNVLYSLPRPLFTLLDGLPMEVVDSLLYLYSPHSGDYPLNGYYLFTTLFVFYLLGVPLFYFTFFAHFHVIYFIRGLPYYFYNVYCLLLTRILFPLLGEYPTVPIYILVSCFLDSALPFLNTIYLFSYSLSILVGYLIGGLPS